MILTVSNFQCYLIHYHSNLLKNQWSQLYSHFSYEPCEMYQITVKSRTQYIFIMAVNLRAVLSH